VRSAVHAPVDVTTIVCAIPMAAAVGVAFALFIATETSPRCAPWISENVPGVPVPGVPDVWQNHPSGFSGVHVPPLDHVLFHATEPWT
jgi:hypothetical protein